MFRGLLTPSVGKYVFYSKESKKARRLTYLESYYVADHKRSFYVHYFGFWFRYNISFLKTKGKRKVNQLGPNPTAS